MDLGLAGKIAVVTGGARSLGASIADALAREGCRVRIADRDRSTADETAGRLCIAGLDASAVTLDVTDPEQVARAFAEITRRDGRLDILVNNAGLLSTGPFRDASPREWDRVVAVNLTGVANCMRAALDPMLAVGGGRVVNIASVAAMRGGGSVGSVLYGTTKAGVVALTKGLARELGPVGITVNAVAPAVVDTAMTETALTDTIRRQVKERIPLRRIATAEDVAGAVAFLASERAAFINGTILPVDGGLLTT